MQVREVRVAYGRTVNLGNYESERVLVGLKATLDDDEPAEQAVKSLLDRARRLVDGQLRGGDQRDPEGKPDARQA